MLKNILIALTLFIVAVPAEAEDFSILAVVNGDVITNHQLQQRITISLGSAGIKDTETARARIALQTLESLIDETLQKQEAKRLKLELEEEEVAKAIASIEKQNNFAPGEFDKFIKQHKIPKDAFLNQVKAQLLWQKLVLKTLQPKIQISRAEVQEYTDRIIQSQSLGSNELEISEILIPVNEPEQEDDAKNLSAQLLEELKEGGDFASIAKEFSRSSSAESGGKIGWVHESDLDTNIQTELQILQPGEVTKPIRTGAGYIIMKLDNRRSLDKSNPITPDEDKVKDLIFRKRLELDARKFMKNLRRTAYIERRI